MCSAWQPIFAQDNLTPVSAIENGRSYALMYDTDGDKKGDLYLTYADSRQMILSEALNQRIMWTFEANGSSTTDFKLVNYKFGTQLGVQQKDRNYVIGTNEGGIYYYTIQYDADTGGFSLLSPAINWSGAGAEQGKRYYMTRTGNTVTGSESPDSHWIIYDVTAIKASIELGIDVDYANRIVRGTKLGQYSASDEDWNAFVQARDEAIVYATRRDVTTEQIIAVNTTLDNSIEKLTLNVPNGNNTEALKGYYRVMSAATKMYINPTLNSSNYITLSDKTSGHNPANTILYYDGTHLYFPTAGKCISKEAWDLGDLNSVNTIKISKSANAVHMCSYYIGTSSNKYLYAGFTNVMNRFSGSSNSDNCAWTFEPVEDLIIDDDLKIFKPIADTKVAHVTYTRAATYVKGTMSVRLPFAFTSEWPVYVFSRLDGNEAVLTKLADNVVPAATPCFIQVGNATGQNWTPEPNLVDGKVAIASDAAPVFGKDTNGNATAEAIYGTFSDKLVTDFRLGNYNYKIASDGEHLSQATDNSYCFAFRAFLHVSQHLNATGMHFNFEENENAIENVAQEPHTGTIYNLQGQPVAADGKGLKIINDRKVIIK